MLLRTGVDLVEVRRFERALERHGERLLARIFTPQEREQCGGKVQSLAARFAAKEAVSKALGTGIGKVGWREIEILTLPNGEPQLVLHGKAAQLARSLGLEVWSLSLSHTAECAVAFVASIGVQERQSQL